MMILPNLAAIALGLPPYAISTGSFPSQIAVELLFTMHRTAVLLTGYLANALYTVSAALLIVATRKDYPKLVQAAGWLVVIGGIWLSGAAYIDSTAGMVASNALILPALIGWLGGVAVTSRQRARSPVKTNY